ncbi:virion structural protein [Vibrio phage Aphrodite1]|uniref:Uncharacterized protein n=1 Tax=Vibrio phage Aphrodite1 TaxID=2070057 RepID=A0A2I7QI22_9CAUD|nr:virion structural protein [Vibrio phage Aphrodite1]AUR81041.1 hypothetical protein Aphrodite1_0099 [Vibrio phage Aphrodite1]
MSDFRKVAYGYVDSRLLDPTLTVINGILRAYVQSSQDMTMQIDPASIKEVIEMGNKITGQDFKHWITANYERGAGRRARLMRAITFFLNGKISARTLEQAITGDEQFVTTTDIKHIKSGNGLVERRNLDEVEDVIRHLKHDDMFRLIEGIGPQMFARMLITFNGESAYA